MLKQLGVSAYDKIREPIDEALCINLDLLANDFDAFYITVTDYNGGVFSNLKLEKDQPVVSLTFYDADNGTKIGSPWEYRSQILPDASGFIIAKGTLKPTMNGSSVSNPDGDWHIQNLSESIKDEDNSGKITPKDILETIIKRKI